MKKRLLCAFLVSSMILGSCTAYAADETISTPDDIAALPVGIMADSTDEAVSSQAAAADILTSAPSSDSEADVLSADSQATPADTAVTAYAADTGYIEIPCTDDNGVSYTLTVKCDYKFNEKTCCQVTNISKDVVCDVVIPAYVPVTLDGVTTSLPVRSIEESAFETAKCTSITLPETVREIKTKAFLNCTNVKTITINSKVLADDAENLNAKGTTIDTLIDSYAFQGCTSLEDVYISGFQNMKDSLFSGCTALKNVTFSTEGMFKVTANKVSSTELTMTMGKNAFEGCTAIETITLPKNFKTLGIEAFKNCTSLKTVNVGPTLTGTLNAASFTGCSAMEQVLVDGANSTFCSIDGLLYKGRVTSPNSLEYCPLANKIGTLTLPSSVTTVAANAAKGHKYLTGVNIDTSKTVTINASAFEACSNLTSLNFNTLVKIGNYAFQDCTSLYELIHGDYDGTIGTAAFKGCTAFTKLSLNGWQQIGANAFYGCTGLTDLVCAADVGTIGNNCFEACTSLKTVDMSLLAQNLKNPTYHATFGTFIFKDCPELETVDLPMALLGISSGTFQNCTKLHTVTTGENTGSINNNAFDNCPALVNAPSPRFLVHIDKNAFIGCTSLKDYEITRSCMKIDDAAFVDCPNITINAPDGSKAIEFAVKNNIPHSFIEDTIQDYEFLSIDINGQIIGYRGGFESLTIPQDFFKYSTGTENVFGASNKAWIDNPYSGTDCSMKSYLKHIDLGGVTEIRANALAGSALETVNLGNAKIIFSGALQNCRNLQTVTIPGTVQVMGSNIFSGCTSLVEAAFAQPVDEATKITFKVPIVNKTVEQYTTNSANIFAGCASLSKVTFSEAVDMIPDGCFSGCKALEEFISSRSCKTIGKTAFKNCTALHTIKFSPLTDRIAQLAFENCTALKTITLQHNIFLEANVFKGCTNINRIIIPQTVNVAISNTPFVSTYDATIICAKDSKGEEYAKAFNDPSTYSSSFMSDAVANSFVGKYHYNIEYGDFVEGVDYVTIKGKLTIPEGVTVTRGGVALSEKDYVIGGDELVVSTTQTLGEKKTLYINANEFTSGETYIVPENEDVIITLITQTELYGDVNYDEIITANDAALVLQHALLPTFNEATIKKADVNGDGLVSANDAAMILQKALDESFKFPVE